MAFPALFPYGHGDPTYSGRERAVSLTDGLKHLIKYAEISRDQPHWRFASHPRFPYWGLNMKQRHQLLSQANVYLQQHPENAAFTVDNLKEMVGRLSAEQLMKRLQRYVAKGQGSSQYWFQRDESDLLLAGETAEQAFQSLLPRNDKCSAYHSRLQKILALQATVKKIYEVREADVEDEQPQYEEDDDPQVEGEAKAAMQHVVDMHDNTADTITLEGWVDMLNADQRRVFEKVKSHFLHQQLHEGNKCQCNLEPLRMFVSGVGGTGKSFLIETIRALVDQLWRSEDLTCAIAAPTGLAAFNVGGTTIHRLF